MATRSAQPPSALVLILGMVCFSALPGCRKSADVAGEVIGTFGVLGTGPAGFLYPRAIAASPEGRIFVVDKSGRVQRFSHDGQFERSWSMPDVQAGKPVGLTVHPDGRLFVADTHYHRVVIFSPDGLLLNMFGTEGTGPGCFLLPTDVAFDDRGDIYVSEYGGNDRITRWTADLKFVGAIGEQPVDGRRLNRPSAVDVDPAQTIWVADACNHRIVRFSRDGRFLSSFGTRGRSPGALRYPYDLTVIPDHTLLICEYGGDRLQWFSTEGRSMRTWGHSGREPGGLSGPWGVARGKDGLIYVVDSMNSRVQILRL